ncbi:COQ9 family protein [Roseivivax sp. CAU 1761]
MPDDPETKLLDAALAHVPFEGWSEATFRAAVAASGVNPVVAKALYPRGGIDLALSFHRRGDAEMRRRLAESDLSALRFRDKVARAVRLRIEAVEDREAVRRGMTLFALPPYAAEGARAIWQTADAIWTALGDTSDDANWYSKRATLAGVYSATILYWLGDDSPGHVETWAFLDRRIDDVMKIEEMKSAVRRMPLLGDALRLTEGLAGRVRRPAGADAAGGGADLPGRRGGAAPDPGPVARVDPAAPGSTGTPQAVPGATAPER